MRYGPLRARIGFAHTRTTALIGGQRVVGVAFERGQRTPGHREAHTAEGAVHRELSLVPDWCLHRVHLIVVSTEGAPCEQCAPATAATASPYACRVHIIAI